MVNAPDRAAMLNQTPKSQYGMVNATLTGLRGIMSAIGRDPLHLACRLAPYHLIVGEPVNPDLLEP